MTKIDFSLLQKTRQPTKRERRLYNGWVKYLRDSRLDDDEIHSRASSYAEQHKKVPTSD